LVPYLTRLNVQQLVLEFATPRAGELAALLSNEEIRASKELGLGVVNPRLEEIEPVESIVSRVEETLRYLPPERIFLNPDCGFGTFSSRPVIGAEPAAKKLEIMAEAARLLREKFG
jgi:5-methyltetrahydropteroyltriglutamate--homocysteine methyltransferase